MTVSFKELFSKARGNSKVPDSILCLDPGETTGYAIFQQQSLVRQGQIRTVTDDKIVWDEIYALIAGDHFDQIVCEDYRIYEHKLSRHAFSPVLTLRLIGGIDLMSKINGIDIHYQMATQAKGFCTDERLKEWGFWQDGMKHARDAIRHGCYFMLFYKRGKDI